MPRPGTINCFAAQTCCDKLNRHMISELIYTFLYGTDRNAYVIYIHIMYVCEFEAEG